MEELQKALVTAIGEQLEKENIQFLDVLNRLLGTVSYRLAEQAKMQTSPIDKLQVVLGTIEPYYDDSYTDDDIAFILGAIRKYSGNSSYDNQLVKYLSEKVCGRVVVEGKRL